MIGYNLSYSICFDVTNIFNDFSFIYIAVSELFTNGNKVNYLWDL